VNIYCSCFIDFLRDFMVFEEVSRGFTRED
jgi:hypothetical protein